MNDVPAMFLACHSLSLATQLPEALDVISSQSAQLALSLAAMLTPVAHHASTHNLVYTIMPKPHAYMYIQMYMYTYYIHDNDVHTTGH